MHIHFIQHEIFEAPGAYLEWATQRGYNVTFSKIYEGHSLPENVEDLDMLIVMGGPQSPDTTKEECPYFDGAAEIAFIQRFIAQGRAVVGVCLGAQLIGEALGARFDHSPEKEIGVFPITLTKVGLGDVKINHFGTSLAVGHWHNDMPGLTTESRVLAESKGCPRQIIAFGDLIYGFQCHMEFTPEVVALLIEEELDFLTNNNGYPYVQKPNEIRCYNYTEMNDKLFVFLDKLSEEYKKHSSYI